MGPKGVASLAKATSAGAGINSIVLDGCALTGATKRNSSDKTFSQDIDSQMDGFVALCAVLGKLERISLVNCGLGPTSAAELSKAVSSAGAVVVSLTISSECTHCT